MSTRRLRATQDTGPSLAPAYVWRSSLRRKSLRTRAATGLRQQARIGIRRCQPCCPYALRNGHRGALHRKSDDFAARYTFCACPEGASRRPFARRASASATAVCWPYKERIKTPSLSIGHGLRGGRWPGPLVERDGLRCYFGRGWVSDGHKIAWRQATYRGGIAAAGMVCLLGLTCLIRVGSSGKKFFSMFSFAHLQPAGRRL